jgi:hypothetical protein
MITLLSSGSTSITVVEERSSDIEVTLPQSSTAIVSPATETNLEVESATSLTQIVTFGGPPGGPGPAGPEGSGTIVRQAGEAIGGHRAVYVASDGLVYYADPENGSAAAVSGVSTGAVSLDGWVTIRTAGEMQESSWGWAEGPIYLGANGVLTQTPPLSGAIVILGVSAGPAAMTISPQFVADLIS